MEGGSLCAMGGMTPYPVKSALEHFSDDFLLPTAEGSSVAKGSSTRKASQTIEVSIDSIKKTGTSS